MSYVPIFVDAKPNEEFDLGSERTLCFVALSAGHMDGVPKLKGYKSTAGVDKKMKSIDGILNALETKQIEIGVLAVAGKMNGQSAHYAVENFNESVERIGAEWVFRDDKVQSLKWNGYEFGPKTVLGLALYAATLPQFGIGIAELAAGSTEMKVKFVLDKLPHSSSEGLSLMEAIRHSPTINNAWIDNSESGIEFSYAIGDKFRSKKGKMRPFKLHPNMILVDWMAVACMATVRPNQLKEEGGYDDGQIERIASVWEATRPSKHALLNHDDPDYQKRLYDFAEKRGLLKAKNCP